MDLTVLVSLANCLAANGPEGADSMLETLFDD